jgi:hypothetical protein
MNNEEAVSVTPAPKQTSAVTQLEQNVDLLRNRLNKEPRAALIEAIIIHKRELAEVQMLLQTVREELKSKSENNSQKAD